MKRIAIIATWCGVVNRGAETFSIELAKKLRHHYKIKVFSVGIAPEIADITTKVTMDMSWWSKVLKWGERSSSIFRKVCGHYPQFSFGEYQQTVFVRKVCREYLQKQDYDLVLACCGGIGAHELVKLRQLKGTPYVYVNHGGLGRSEFLALLDKPDCYVTISNLQRRWAEYHYSRVRRIPNGVDCARFAVRKNTIKKEKIVLDVAALTAFKRPKLLIDAMRYVPDAKLLLVGRGEMEAEVREYGKAVLGDRFELKAVPYVEMPSIYQQASVFSLPSYDEPFGIVYLEAMASGLPVVAPDDEIRQELVGKAGITCNVTNGKAYATAIKRAFATEWGDKPVKQAKKYDWEMIAEQYRNLFEDVMSDYHESN